MLINLKNMPERKLKSCPSCNFRTSYKSNRLLKISFAQCRKEGYTMEEHRLYWKESFAKPADLASGLRVGYNLSHESEELRKCKFQVLYNLNVGNSARGCSSKLPQACCFNRCRKVYWQWHQRLSLRFRTIQWPWFERSLEKGRQCRWQVQAAFLLPRLYPEGGALQP